MTRLAPRVSTAPDQATMRPEQGSETRRAELCRRSRFQARKSDGSRLSAHRRTPGPADLAQVYCDPQHHSLTQMTTRRSPMKRLHHSLFVALVACTLLPLAAAAWIRSPATTFA